MRILCVSFKTSDKCGMCGRSPGELHRHLLKGTARCAKCCSCAPKRSVARPAASKPGIVAAAAAKVAKTVSRFVDAGPRRDPWYSDTARRKAAGCKESWVPSRPDWFCGGRAPHVSASIMGPDGSVRPVQAPDYEPRRFDPEGR
jgi:hypothetical protein